MRSLRHLRDALKSPGFSRQRLHHLPPTKVFLMGWAIGLDEAVVYRTSHATVYGKTVESVPPNWFPLV